MGPASLIVAILAVANCALAAPKKKWAGETRLENGVEYQCKCYSDNKCWPKKNDWRKLNETIGGALRIALPPGAVCHRNVADAGVSVFDAAACDEVQANWLNEQWL